MVCEFILLYRYMLEISLSKSFLLTFMECVLKKRISAFCCVYSVLLNVCLKVHQMPCLRRQILWTERAGRDVSLEALWSYGVTPRFTETTALISSMSSCFSVSYSVGTLWLALLAGGKESGQENLPKAIQHNINQSFCSWEQLAIPFHCKATIKFHF